MNAKDRQHKAWQDALISACVAGVSSARATTPAPMYVGTPKDLVGSLMGGDGGGFDAEKPIYRAASGVCGFASVNFTKDQRFANWLTGKVASKYPAAAALGDYPELGKPRSDPYYGGVTASVFGYGQSLTLKESFARAFARSLGAAVPSCQVWAQSRMD